METSKTSLHRRAFVVNILVAVGMGITGLPGMMRTAFAWSLFSRPKGMRKVVGEVKINGIPAEVNALVQPGDVVSTGPDGFAIFVIGKSVYLLRENTRIVLSSETSDRKKKIVNLLRLISGKLLFVSRGARKNIITQTAVIGLRGSGIYVEAEPERTYICTCYGVADIEAKSDSGVKETVRTKHHEAPRYVYTAGARQLIVKAPIKNHTDKELIKLERMAGRRPPFVETGSSGGY